jgi:hypothetical protein
MVRRSTRPESPSSARALRTIVTTAWIGAWVAECGETLPPTEPVPTGSLQGQVTATGVGGLALVAG